MLTLPLYDDSPHPRVPIVVYGLIAACVLVFVWQLGLSARGGHDAIFAYGMTPAVLLGNAHLPAGLHALPPWATLLTHMFLHGGWLHLAGNILYLWLFGRGVEAALGSVRCLGFYLICGVAAALVQAAVDPGAKLPMVGASGAIAGILGAYLVLYPRGNVTVLFWLFIFVRLISVPAVIMLGLWFLLQLFDALSAAPGEPGIAFWAHVGGFVVGAALTLLLRPRHVPAWQVARTRAFGMTEPGPFARRSGHGSVPSAGRPRGPRN
jgi:membrane associated rhomboid family serine protease